MLLMLILISIVSYSMVRLLPGDPVQAMLGEQGDPKFLARARAELGLDQPAPLYYFVWVGRVLTGDFGRSILTNRPVIDSVRGELVPTIELTIMAALMTALMALPLGIAAAYRHGSLVDIGASTFAMVGLAIPSFCLGLLFIFLVSLILRWLPPSGWRDPFTDPLQSTRYMLLPALTLALAFAAALMRQVRSSLLEVLPLDYMRTARAKGLRDRQVLLRHALRNALIPIITIVGLMIGRLLGGAVIVEIIFAIPGIGRGAVDAIFGRDYPVIQTIVLLIAGIVLIVNLIVDLLYALVDPRIRYG
jgi:peptide/nickel transport system permease protein